MIDLEVLGLSLTNNGLGGELPTQLGDLTSMTAGVDFADNTIGGTIPTQVLLVGPK